MKFTPILTAVLCLGTVLVHAAGIELNGKFLSDSPPAAPAGWKLNRWAGYQPLAKLSVEELDGVKAMRISEVNGRAGCGVYAVPLIPVKAGDTLCISARVRGTGKCTFGIEYRSAADAKGFTAHLGQRQAAQSVALTGQWQPCQAEIAVGTTPKGEPSSVLLTIAVPKTGELYITDIEVSVRHATAVGNARFPREWRIFGPVSIDEAPPLDRIPDAVGGTAGRRTMLESSSNTLDMRPVLPQPKLRDCAWAFATLTSEYDGNYTIGAGADYFMAVYVNGVKSIDTLEKGNAVSATPHFSNYTAQVRLHKGANIIAVKFLSGSGTFPRLSLGGAEELRGMADKLSMVETFAADDYDSPTAPRAGTPRLIQDHPTPGWLQLTGQGVYRTGSTIGFADRKFTVPSTSSERLLATGIRLQNLRGNASLNFQIDGRTLLTVAPDGPQHVNIAATSNGQVIESLRVPLSALPADILLAVRADRFFVNIASLADGKLRAFSGSFTRGGFPAEAATGIAVGGPDGATATVDNYTVGLAAHEVRTNLIPFQIALDETFDPVRAGWPLVWSDEFNGEKVDLANTWFVPSWTPDAPLEFLTQKDGMLHIRAEMKAGEKRPRSIGIRSRRLFQYGFFEARLRFTKHPGWWAAFWMLTHGRSMPTAGGSELDIFEDYSTRRGNERLIANNFHTFMGAKQKSFGYTFELPGSVDDFYTIALKWTPFEISYYLNGKLIKTSARHSPWQSMTYDAVNHAFPNAPNQLVLSGQVGNSGGRATAPFVEEFLVDYVRVYAMPAPRNLKAFWRAVPDANVLPPGAPAEFKLDAQSEKNITGAYLFDNGYLIDFRAEPPYHFTVPMTAAHYADTRWGAPDAQNRQTPFDGYPHFFQAAIQNSAGEVAVTDVFPLIVRPDAGVPAHEQPAAIPGSIDLRNFNEGGSGRGYYKADRKPATPDRRKFPAFVHDGEWFAYTVSIPEAGRYRALLQRGKVRDITRGTDVYPEADLTLLLDGKIAGQFRFASGSRAAVLEGIDLPAGPRTLTLMMIGGKEMVVETLNFTPEQNEKNNQI